MAAESPAHKDNQPLKTYKSRFWILFFYSILSWFQALQWNLFGPLSESMAAAFDDWNSNTIAMMANWGPISFLLCAIPSFWLSDKKGLRVSIIIMSGTLFLSAILRVLALFSSSDLFFKIMCHISAFFNGTMGPLAMTLAPVISSVWFPPHERTTATAFGQLINALGSAGSYLEPLIVRSPEKADRQQIRSDISKLMYICLGITTVFLIAAIAYYPSKPPTPPSISSTKERINFKSSGLSLLRNLQFQMVVFSMVVSVSIPTTWISVLNLSLKDLGIDQDEAMWIGFLAVVSSAIFGIVIGRLTDLLYGHLRITILLMMCLELAFFYWFFVIAWGCTDGARWQIYISVILGFSFSLGTMPLFTELVVESAFPCSELVAAGFLTYGENVVGFFFLLIFLVPNIGYDWVTYLLLFTSSIPLIPLVFVKENYKRTNIDEGGTPTENQERISSRPQSISSSLN